MESSSGSSLWGKLEEKKGEKMNPFWTEEKNAEAERNELLAVKERLAALGCNGCEIVPIYVLDDAICHANSKAFLEKKIDLANVIYYARGQIVSKMKLIRLSNTSTHLIVNVLVEKEKEAALYGRRKRKSPISNVNSLM
jgi:hypothetical protein